HLRGSLDLDTALGGKLSTGLWRACRAGRGWESGANRGRLSRPFEHLLAEPLEELLVVRVHDAGQESDDTSQTGRASVPQRRIEHATLSAQTAMDDPAALRHQKQTADPQILGVALLPDIALLDQRAEHAVEALQRDAQDARQLAYPYARAKLGEDERPVVAATDPPGRQQRVDGRGGAALGEEETEQQAQLYIQVLLFAAFSLRTHDT